MDMVELERREATTEAENEIVTGDGIECLTSTFVPLVVGQVSPSILESKRYSNRSRVRNQLEYTQVFA